MSVCRNDEANGGVTVLLLPLTYNNIIILKYTRGRHYPRTSTSKRNATINDNGLLLEIEIACSILIYQVYDMF